MVKQLRVLPAICLLLLLTACGSAPILSHYGDTQGRVGPHAGVDFAASTGTPVIAGADGEVVYTASGAFGASNCGTGVLLVHPSLHPSLTVYTVYCHLERHEDGLRPGQKVKRGEIIGYVGTTGNARTPHVHWQVCKYSCIWGTASGDLWGTIDPLTITAGCFDAKKAHPADKLTYPLRCKE